MTKTKTKRVKVKVTKEDIAKGKACNTHYCPIARAVARALDIPCVYVSVNGGTLAYARDKDDNSKRYMLSFKAQQFVDTFDQGHKVRPFNFMMSEYDPEGIS